MLEPGESVETLVASEPVTEDRLTGEMTWRVRLRIGPYRTDFWACDSPRTSRRCRDHRRREA